MGLRRWEKHKISCDKKEQSSVKTASRTAHTINSSWGFKQATLGSAVTLGFGTMLASVPCSKATAGVAGVVCSKVTDQEMSREVTNGG